MLRRAGGLALSIVLVLWGAATLAFLAFRVLPGDPVGAMLGPQAQVSEAVKAQIRTELGLDRPLWQQYLSSLGDLLRGDLGTSYQLRMPVSEVIGAQLGATLQLTGLAFAIAVLLALAGVLLARRPLSRGLVAAGELIVLSSPVFWIGLLLLGVFAFGLGWFPVSGSRTGATQGLLSGGRIVQVDEGMAVNGSMQDRKILSDLFQIQFLFARYGFGT